MIIKLIRKFFSVVQTTYIGFKIYLVGNNLITVFPIQFYQLKKAKIGENVFIGQYFYNVAEIIVGDRVMIGPYVKVIGGNHLFGKVGEYPRFITPVNNENNARVFIEDDAWIGLGVTILGGVTIGEGCVIGAGSIVTKNMPPYCVCRESM